MSTIPHFLILPYSADLTEVASRLARFEDLAWLTSSGRRGGRYDILAAAPSATVRFDGRRLEIGDEAITTEDPFEALRIRYPAAPDQRASPPFTSGFIGYLGYPLHASCERQVQAPADPTGMPMLRGGIYDWAVVADHRLQQTCVVGRSAPPDEVMEALRSPRVPLKQRYALTSPFRSTMSEDAYRAAFAELKEHILSGDCYQVNLARHFAASCSGDPLALFSDFQRLQGASYGALLNYEEGVVLSVSPERFAYGRDGVISTWPIKGTAPRASHVAEDRRLADELRRSSKNHAENLMIVDLLRNDLGRICEIGSVQVDALCHATRHSNVHHLQSVVSGRPRPGVGAWEALAAIFPCGSITGAPKIKAIDIINELEPVGRSAYCGAIGYVDSSGQFDFNVAIRTAVYSDNELHVWGGGGIVADSQASEELEEIEAKIGRLLRGLNQLQ